MISNILNFFQSWIGNLSDALLLFCLIFTFVALIGMLWKFYQHSRPDLYGAAYGVPMLILVAVTAVFITGYKTPQPLIGDEVTHFYMLKTQADDLSQPNFTAKIPMITGVIEERDYNHSFLWHYFGAVVYYLSGNKFIAVQIYQTMYFGQLLLIAYLLARSRGGVPNRAALVYTLTLASLPAVLVYSVTFYQDIPMAAQVLTAFYLLERRRWLLASAFIALALGLKVTAILFFPAFFVLLACRLLHSTSLSRATIYFACSFAIVLGFTWGLGKTIKIYTEAEFYPQQKLELMTKTIRNKLYDYFRKQEDQRVLKEPDEQITRQINDAPKVSSPVIIANHPGDLRIKENYLIYGGAVLYLVLAGFIVSIFVRGKTEFSAPVQRWYSANWLWFTGGSYIIITAWLSRSAPDARFFVPGLVFILLPLSEGIVRLPRAKLLITILTSLALLQSGYVLAKTSTLRSVQPYLLEAITYLKEHMPDPDRIFMYPEGNYRFFPVEHEWYLGYQLRDLWHASNDDRISLLNYYGIGAIVIKKHLISQVDDEITDLGVYPVKFVNDIANDSRFIKSYENSGILIYQVPPAR